MSNNLPSCSVHDDVDEKPEESFGLRSVRLEKSSEEQEFIKFLLF